MLNYRIKKRRSLFVVATETEEVIVCAKASTAKQTVMDAQALEHRSAQDLFRTRQIQPTAKKTRRSLDGIL
jgi:hypothetical protein